MDKLTIEQAIIIMGYTGISTLPFSVFHEDVEKRLNRTVFTHEFPKLSDEIKNSYKEDFLKLCPISKENNNE